MPDSPKKLVADLCEVIEFLEDRSAARPLTSPEASGPTPSGRPASARPFPSPQAAAAPHHTKLTLARGARTQPFSSQACPSSYQPLRSHRGEDEQEAVEDDDDEATQVPAAQVPAAQVPAGGGQG